MVAAIRLTMFLGAVGVLAAAVTAADTTRAADATSTTDADAGSPKGAAKALFRAVAAGDRAGVRGALYAADAKQAALVDATADLIVNGKRLGDAARGKFGDAADPIGKGMLDPADLGRLDAAKVRQSGDTAILEVAGQSRPMSFRRGDDGAWRLVVTDFRGAGPDRIDEQTRLVRKMAEALEESAAEIAAGKYAAPETAILAIQRRLHEVMQTFNRPATTRTSTAPATVPAPRP